jgi:hypothetical protein
MAVRTFLSSGFKSVLSIFEMDFLDSFLRNDIVSGTQHNESLFQHGYPMNLICKALYQIKLAFL